MKSGISIEAIREALRSDRWITSRHARERAGKRRIDSQALTRALLKAEILEQYPDDPRGPSALLLGYAHDRPVHAVCAFNPDGILLIVTLYEPELPKWADARTRQAKVQ